MKIYRVVVAEPAENRERTFQFEAVSYAEALTMAERKFAGIAETLIGIPRGSYDLARAEGIDFNEADGLLI